MTPDGEEILLDGDAIVLPDILANADGVTVSYFEWGHNLHWTGTEIQTRLERMMGAAFERVWDLHEEQDCSLHGAAYVLAVRRVAEASEIHGVFP